ncbi:hypothetical protein E2C01_031563 [Portunus trituberculatus]|uniref:Uncharacterized protein n=1 Tax=Portunus trituberculatus TaxID=210409 RepID=A0A5B7EUV9_PORTR|nr:hypothetical protein [Portunus trituberculatus]
MSTEAVSSSQRHSPGAETYFMDITGTVVTDNCTRPCQNLRQCWPSQQSEKSQMLSRRTPKQIGNHKVFGHWWSRITYREKSMTSLRY